MAKVPCWFFYLGISLCVLPSYLTNNIKQAIFQFSSLSVCMIGKNPKYWIFRFFLDFCLNFNDLLGLSMSKINEFNLALNLANLIYFLLFQLNPMSPTGAEQRYYVHPSTRNTYLPRKMFPTEQYALANREWIMIHNAIQSSLEFRPYPLKMLKFRPFSC